MDTDIRKYIKKNMADCKKIDVQETILASVNQSDEVVLPGLGVLFEMLWNNSDTNLKNSIVDTLYNDIKKSQY